MPARLVFLGRLEDLAGFAQLPCATGPLADILAGLAPELQAALAGPRIKIAVNGQLVTTLPESVAEDDEIAFLPPVSGG